MGDLPERNGSIFGVDGVRTMLDDWDALRIIVASLDHELPRACETMASEAASRRRHVAAGEIELVLRTAINDALESGEPWHHIRTAMRAELDDPEWEIPSSLGDLIGGYLSNRNHLEATRAGYSTEGQISIAESLRFDYIQVRRRALPRPLRFAHRLVPARYAQRRDETRARKVAEEAGSREFRRVSAVFTNALIAEMRSGRDL